MTRRTLLGGAATASLTYAANDEPLRVCLGGLAHGHARGFFSRNLARTDLKLLGVSEADTALRTKYLSDFKLDSAIGFDSIDSMLSKLKPEVVLLFTNTFDHLAAVESCAKHKVPVVMEKPLAVSNDHAKRMQRAASAAGIPVLVNYETTWYASNYAARNIVREGRIGPIRKVVIHDGHQGPKEIGTGPEFFSWLTDPEKNGAGALFDFGCYGANLMTWLMNNQRPASVTAVIQTIKPEIYQHVDDEATVILEYPSAQAIIQASWNWPYSRKDMEIYGKIGAVRTIKADRIAVLMEGKDELQMSASPIPAPGDDFLRYVKAVVRREIKPDGLSSLENNMIVTEILDAARRSAKAGAKVRL
jgi:predicted dehydrogenase